MEWNILQFLLSGWAAYWALMLARGYKTNTNFSFKFFLKDNAIEAGISLLSCFLLVFWGFGNTPTDQSDILMDVGLGATAGTTLDNIITAVKPMAITPKQP